MIYELLQNFPQNLGVSYPKLYGMTVVSGFMVFGIGVFGASGAWGLAKLGRSNLLRMFAGDAAEAFSSEATLTDEDREIPPKVSHQKNAA